MVEKAVISASRTKDPVRCSPELLAGIVEGRELARISRWGPASKLSPQEIGALILWTKDPENIVTNTRLQEALRNYVSRYRGVVILNLTVTGLGGTVLEPGIPRSEDVFHSTRRALESGLVEPEGVVLRYDPLVEVKLPSGERLGNMNDELFCEVVSRFAPLGIRRLKISHVDYGYAHVPKRLASLGIEPVFMDEPTVIRFIEKCVHICRALGVRLDVCCNPQELVAGDTTGCIDGRMINELLDRKGAGYRVTEIRHNELGRQRKSCMCTYSRDIGSTAGITGCFDKGGACLYCYSHRNLRGSLIERTREMIGSGIKPRRAR